MKCLTKELNTMFPARARTLTVRSGDERINHVNMRTPSLFELNINTYAVQLHIDVQSDSSCGNALAITSDVLNSVHAAVFSFLV